MCKDKAGVFKRIVGTLKLKECIWRIKIEGEKRSRGKGEGLHGINS